MSLQGRVAVITGGARGIGKAIANRLAHAGCVVALMDVQEQLLKEVVADLTRQGYRSFGFVGDVSNSTDVKHVVKLAVESAGTVDILVNNAGVSFKKGGEKIPFFEIPEEQWDRVLDINLKGPFLCSQAVAPIMMDQRYGRIVNISSMAAKLGASGPAGAHYSASKAGLSCLTKSLAYELAPYNIRVNAVAPGVIKTDIFAASSPEINQRFLERIPMNRFGTVEEVAEAVHFLISDASSYFTGEIMDVNGGIIMD